MRLSISTNMDPALIEGVKETNVTQVFGKLSNDFIGGGLENHNLSNKTLSKEDFEKHVKLVQENGLSFNYTFNSPSLMNKEYTSHGKKKLRELLDYILDVGVNEVTVANFALIAPIIKHYPTLDLKISATMQVDNVQKAKTLEDLGVTCIVLDPMQVNREFEMLSAIRQSVDCDLELIVNNNCLWQCPVLNAHQTFLGHSSQNGTVEGIDHDYIYVKRCAQDRINNPESWIIADWIRPEDLTLYEDIGYDFFKIIDRATPTDILVRRAKAYSERRYDGNLLDLIQHWGYRDLAAPEDYIDNVYIDNRKLDSFYKFFTNKSCSTLDCGNSCRYCFEYSDTAVSIKPEFQERYNKLHKQMLVRSENFDN